MSEALFRYVRNPCADIFTSLRWALSRAPLILWTCAQNPVGSLNELIGIIDFSLREVLPWITYGLLRDAARFLIIKEYWSRYNQWKDFRTEARKRTRRELTPCGLRRTGKQADSHFLTKLPSEIRNQIYELCFEDQKLLVVPVKRQLHTKLVSFSAQDRHLYNPDDLAACESLLGLPLTCKQIYAETIDMLYSRTTFCFMQPEQIVPFHKQLLPQRWNAITSIEFDSDLYHRLRKLDMDLPAHSSIHRSEAWLKFWSLVNTMKGLERVLITRTDLGLRFDDLSAMQQVKKRLEVFDVYLAETQIMCDPVDVDLKTTQFKLFLPSGQQYLADPPLSGPAGNYGGVMERMHQAWWQM